MHVTATHKRAIDTYYKELSAYQDKNVTHETALRSAFQNLLDLLTQFFDYTEPDIETFETAVHDFKERIPDLAQGLLARIKEEHARNAKFVSAFASFLELCHTSLNPNMSRETVDEMLVQH